LRLAARAKAEIGQHSMIFLTFLAGGFGRGGALCVGRLSVIRGGVAIVFHLAESQLSNQSILAGHKKNWTKKV